MSLYSTLLYCIFLFLSVLPSLLYFPSSSLLYLSSPSFSLYLHFCLCLVTFPFSFSFTGNVRGAVLACDHPHHLLQSGRPRYCYCERFQINRGRHVSHVNTNLSSSLSLTLSVFLSLYLFPKLIFCWNHFLYLFSFFFYVHIYFSLLSLTLTRSSILHILSNLLKNMWNHHCIIFETNFQIFDELSIVYCDVFNFQISVA